ncbi:MAG: hypothetical protein ABIG71_02460 [Candidatus Uhrbacteria bacterium]
MDKYVAIAKELLKRALVLSQNPKVRAIAVGGAIAATAWKLGKNRTKVEAERNDRDKTAE